MEATVVQPQKVQAEAGPKSDRIALFRWSKWIDGDGKLWIVTLLHGFENNGHGHWGANIELLDVDSETIVDVPRAEVIAWIKSGAMKRVDTPIMI